MVFGATYITFVVKNTTDISTCATTERIYVATYVTEKKYVATYVTEKKNI